MIFKTQDIRSFTYTSGLPIIDVDTKVDGVIVRTKKSKVYKMSSSAVLKIVGFNEFLTYTNRIVVPIQPYGRVGFSLIDGVSCYGVDTITKRRLYLNTTVYKWTKKISDEDMFNMLIDYHVTRYDDINRISMLKDKDHMMTRYKAKLNLYLNPNFTRNRLREISRLRTESVKRTVFNGEFVP